MTATTIMQRKPGRPSRAPASLPDLYPVEVPRSEPPARTFFGELDHREALYMGTAHVLVWSWCRREREPTLFDAAEARGLERDVAEASLPRDLSRALVLLARRLGKKRIDPIAVALACVEVGDCAVARGARQSALLWSEAAAAVVPWNPRFAWLAGRLHRRWDDCRQAEHWLERAARVAVRVDDRYTQALALNSLGNVYQQTGNYLLAHEYLTRALKRARRHRLGTLEPEILHDLSLLSTAMERFRDAERYGTAAFEKYGAGHPNLPKLGHDLALIWASQGFFDRALGVYVELLSHFELPDDRLRVLAALVRCAGASGHAADVERYWSEAWTIIEGPISESLRATTLVDLGKGAGSVMDWDRATVALERAVRAAESSGEADAFARAESALAAVRSHRQTERAPRHVRENPDSERLAENLKARLRPMRSNATGSAKSNG